MTSKPKKEKTKKGKQAVNIKPTPASIILCKDTLEEAEESISTHVDEKYQKSIMDIIQKAKEKKKKPNDDSEVTTVNFLRTEESNQTDKYIIILRTTSSTLIVPILMYTGGNIDISLEISNQRKNIQSLIDKTDKNGNVLSRVINNSKVPLTVESDIENHEGLVPLLVIPHKSEDNDNDASISQIINFLKFTYSNHITIRDCESFESDVTIKLVIIKDL